jgi:hypothetical protein
MIWFFLWLAQGATPEGLRRCDGHFHLTAEYQNPAWQRLARLPRTAEGTTRMVASTVVVDLLQEELSLADECPTCDLVRLDERIERVMQAIDQGVPAPQVVGIARHGVVVERSGKLLRGTGWMLTAGNGVRFAPAADHVHIVAEEGERVAIAVPLSIGEKPKVPRNAFFEEVRGVVQPKTLETRLQAVLDRGGVVSRDGRFFVTRALDPSLFGDLAHLILHPRQDTDERAALREVLRQILRTELPIESERAVTRRIDQVTRSLQKLRSRARMLAS